MAAPEPLILKVMRLRQPGMQAPEAVPRFGGPAVPTALVPMALQKSLVGEQFTGYLHVTNSSSQTVQNIGLRVEIDVGYSKFTLLNTGATERSSLAPGESLDALVDHALNAAGTYALTCVVYYSWNGEQAQLKRSYRFPALPPFAVSQRVVQLDGQLLIECLIENSTEGSIYLSSWRLDCAEGLQSVCETDPLEGSGGPLLKQRGCFSLVFRLTPPTKSTESSDAVALPTVSGMEALGTLALLWQVPDGPRGILRHPIQVKPLQVSKLDLEVVKCPSQVDVERPFQLELQVTNRTDERLDVKVGFDLRMMGALKLQGPCQQALQVEARQRQRLLIELIVTVPGLHNLQGVFMTCDQVAAERLDPGVLCELLAF